MKIEDFLGKIPENLVQLMRHAEFGGCDRGAEKRTGNQGKR
jgi:hypothetical protein